MSIQGFDFAHGLLVTDAHRELAHTGELQTPFRLASVTKTVVAWAIATRVDAGVVSFDDVVGPEGATVRHLLAHASGLDFNSDRVVATPGERRIYSNRGIEVVADYVARACGCTVAQLVSRFVCEPLGMSSWVLDGSPAYAGVATVADMACFAREVMRPSLLSEDTGRQMLTVQFSDLDGILPGYGKQSPNPWGLGFEIRGRKSPHWTADGASPHVGGHFGQSGSFLWVDRELELAAVFAGERDFSDVHKKIWPLVNEQILATWGSGSVNS